MASRRRDAVLEALVSRQGTARSQVEANTLARIRRLVAGMRSSWYDPKALDGFHAAASSVVRQGQVIVGNTSATAADRALVSLDVRPAREGFALPVQLRDVEPDVEWERPAKVYRRLRVEGLDELKAQLAAEERAAQLVAMDLALAAREASRQRYEAADVTRYRRIFHPELAKGGSCGLCVVASDQVYKTAELLPLHNGCNCTTLPVLVDNDPGLRLNQDDLQALYDAAGGSTFREELQRVRVTVNEHGELGPILTAKGDVFRDAADAERDTRAA